MCMCVCVCVYIYRSFLPAQPEIYIQVCTGIYILVSLYLYYQNAGVSNFTLFALLLAGQICFLPNYCVKQLLFAHIVFSVIVFHSLGILLTRMFVLEVYGPIAKIKQNA